MLNIFNFNCSYSNQREKGINYSLGRKEEIKKEVCWRKRRSRRKEEIRRKYGGERKD